MLSDYNSLGEMAKAYGIFYDIIKIQLNKLSDKNWNTRLSYNLKYENCWW